MKLGIVRSAVCVVLCMLSISLAHAAVRISPSNLYFGGVVQGTSSAPKVLTLTNGQSTALTIISIAIDLPDYTQTNNCPLSPATLAANATCTINVTFTPTAATSLTATLSVNDDASNSPQKSTLHGNGISPVTATPASISFGNQPTNKKSAGKVVTVKNNQSTALTINGISTNLADFTTTTTCPLSPATLAAGTTCKVTVFFTPATTGARSGTLTVSDNAIVSPTVSLSGTGILAASLNPTSLSFADQALGTTSPSQTLTLTNNQSTNLGISSIVITPNDYSYTTTCPLNPSKLAAGASCTATVTFAPKAIGSRPGSLTFTDDGTNSPQIASLAGNGIAATLVSIAVTPSSASINAGSTQQFTATGTYTDGSTQNLTASATWSSSDTSRATVAPGGLATGVSGGTASITATSGSVSGSASLTVVQAALVSIAITPNPASVPRGGTQQFTATGTYSDNTTQNLTASVTWSSSSPGVATISNASGTQGLATSLAVGATTISADLSGVTGNATFNVTNAPCVGPCVLTYHGNASRDGVTSGENVLTPSNVNSSSFGRVGSVTGLNGQIYTQPLYMSGLYSASSQGNVVFVATQTDYVYAIDADTYQTIWSKQFLVPGESPLSAGSSTSDITCGNIKPSIGITGTPVIDPNTTLNPNPVMYFVTKSVDASKTYHQRLHAVDVVTGNEVFGGPVDINTPIGSTETFDLLLENPRPGLALTYDGSQNPQIYISWGSHCDTGSYRGWMMKYTVTSGTLSAFPTAYFTATHGAGKFAGIWMGGGAPAVDSAGNLYVTTGDGTYDGSANWGETVLKLDSNLNVVDWYTPNTWLCLEGITGNSNCPTNFDFGSGGVILFNVPGGTPEIAAAGKAGEVYVIYQSNMGHLDPLQPTMNYVPPPNCTFGPPLSGGGGPNNIAQCFPGITKPASGASGSRSTPAFWNSTLYVAGSGDLLRAYSLDPNNIGSFVTTGASASTPANYPYPGSTAVVSWNGTDAFTGVLWTLQTNGWNSVPPLTANLRAYTAVPNGTSLDLLYTSTVGPGVIKFQVPTVVNGKVFVAGQGFSGTGTEGQLYVYGPCPCN